MGSLNFQERFHRHTQLQLRSFYSRFTQAPWRPLVLFCGNLEFAPYKESEKKVFLATTESSSFETTHSCGFPLLLEDFQELPFFDGSVNTLICYFNQQMPNTSILHEFYRVLSPSGKLILTVNNRYGPYYFLKNCQLSDNLSDIEAALELYQFLILKTASHSYYPPTSSKHLLLKSLKYQKFLGRYFKKWANQYSFICVKKTDYHHPIPSYLQLTEHVPLSGFFERVSSSVIEAPETGIGYPPK